ncbi:RNase H family protein [Rathayibacter sp. YIM 133350]|uniref:RNase H family protein n=1 Tax=Rathayibacter sp. YIM 133350 TaxID=3131992 RepID=UPI00307ECF96
MTITAAADGSALGNPGPAGWAWYVDEHSWAAGGWPHGTNNIGELTAVLELFRATAHLDDDLLILCDSQYVINSITKWMPGWKRKGWRKGDGKPVMNLELMQDLDAAISGRRYRFEWVKGHAGHPLNEAADERARGAAEAYQRGTPVPSGPGYTVGGTVLSTARPEPVPEARPEPRAAVAPRSAPVAADGTRSAPVAAERTTAPARSTVSPAPAAAASAHPTLFDAAPEPLRELTLRLTADQYARLARRAADEGVTAEEWLLRRL